MEQSPQCCGLSRTSTQLLPHCASPGAQLEAQAPSEQTSPAAHGRSHAPQCRPSSPSETHDVPQLARPDWHWHWLSRQRAPTVHAEPHAPQCSPLLRVSTHTPPHESKPAGQGASVLVHPKMTSDARASRPARRARSKGWATRYTADASSDDLLDAPRLSTVVHTMDSSNGVSSFVDDRDVARRFRAAHSSAITRIARVVFS
jgi:hypothetical protein